MKFEKMAEKLGAYFRDLRQQHGLSQQQLADKAGITRQHLTRLEAGGNPKLLTLVRLADALKIELAFLMEKMGA